MRDEGLKDRVCRYIRAKGLIAPGDRVLAAVSGGADSVAMLHLLLSLREELRIGAVEAAHVHHGLRGEDADRDEAFVRRLCEEWQVPLHVQHAKVGQLAEQRRRAEREQYYREHGYPVDHEPTQRFSSPDANGAPRSGQRKGK